MLYYHDGLQRVWYKSLTALENTNLIPTVNFGKLSVMVWACILSKRVAVIRILEETMTKEKMKFNILNINFNFASPGYFTTVLKLLLLLPKILILTLLKILEYEPRLLRLIYHGDFIFFIYSYIFFQMSF